MWSTSKSFIEVLELRALLKGWLRALLKCLSKGFIEGLAKGLCLWFVAFMKYLEGGS